MPQLDPSYFASQLFWLALCFTALYLLMRYFALPKAEKALMHRDDHITQGLHRAERKRKKIAQVQHELSLKTAQNRVGIEREYKASLSAQHKEYKKSIHTLNKKLFAQEMTAEKQVYQTLREDEEINLKQARVIASIILSKLTNANIDEKDLAKFAFKEVE